MKKVILIVLLAAPAFVFAQKPIKPNLNKALGFWKDGKFKEAKEMIDICVTDPKLSLNGETYYYKGLIYASLDTTSKEEFKSLTTNPLDIAVESFKKADELGKAGTDYFVRDVSGFPVLRTQQIDVLNAHYINKGATRYQEDDFAGALGMFEKSMKVKPDDTTSYFFACIVAQNLEEFDKAISNINSYIDKGGKSHDVYMWLINIYSNHKDDKNKALEISRQAITKFPHISEFTKLELGFLIDLDKIDEAKAGLEKALEQEPDNKTLHFYLGFTNLKQDKLDVAKANFEDALKLDPQYFEAQIYLSRIIGEDAKVIKRQMNALGITAADKKKKMELDGAYVAKLKVALPYWEKAEKLNPSDQEVLTELYSIYSDLGNDAQVARIEKRLKELGID